MAHPPWNGSHTKETNKIGLLNGERSVHPYTDGKMKHDTNWETARTSYDPLKFMVLIEKTILDQIEDQYPFATVYEQEV